MYRIIHSFLLVLAAIVAVSLLVAPRPAWTTTEAAPPHTSASLEVERSAGAVPAVLGRVCSNEISIVAATDIDPECFETCEEEKRRCMAAEEDDCYSNFSMCEADCVAGHELDPDNEPVIPKGPRSPGTECWRNKRGCDGGVVADLRTDFRRRIAPGGGTGAKVSMPGAKNLLR